MPRPGLRPMRVLPVLEPRREALEKCVFCPKLCRSACPVSNAEPRETITPWGKMSLAWMAAHGDVPIDRSHAAPAWACTGCFACRESCDHRNPTADVLFDARDALARHGVLPDGARHVLDGFVRHDESTRQAARELASHPRVRADARDALLVGCGYLRGAPREARDAVDAASALTGEPVAIVEGCCGLPLRLAGDREGFARQAAEMARSLEGRDRVTVVDAGCALTLKRRYAEAGVELPSQLRVELLVEQAAGALARMKHVPHDRGAGAVARPLSARARSRCLRRTARGPRARPRPRTRRVQRPRAPRDRRLLRRRRPLALDDARGRARHHRRAHGRPRARGRRPRRDRLRIEPARDAQGRAPFRLVFQRRGR